MQQEYNTYKIEWLASIYFKMHILSSTIKNSRKNFKVGFGICLMLLILLLFTEEYKIWPSNTLAFTIVLCVVAQKDKSFLVMAS